MTARAALPVGGTYMATVVPKDAVVLAGQEASVYLVENGQVRRVAVAMGMSRGEWMEVKGDLKVGDRVVVRGNERLVPGQAVAIAGEIVLPEQEKAP